ncbi:uncharacterized protein V6R79_007667 [Siganus canaliculatus]
MKHTRQWNQTTPVTAQVKTNSSHSLQVRSHLLKRVSGVDTQGPSAKNHLSQQRYEECAAKTTCVIYRQEMASFFRLFEDDLIQDFLWMDCCCKMTDKYLLAMAFVYFKRAHFTIAEYTRRNLFIALYLANTMEEDEEESKYEIFPWALGKNWRKQFPSFLKQRDKLWARIEYRAAVSKRCCEEVMAVVPSHFVWQRERSEHHSGAKRQYGDQDHSRFPRGPSASPVFCALCNDRFDQGSGSSTAHSPVLVFEHPFTSTVSLEVTPPRIAASRRKAVETKVHVHQSTCRESSFECTHDSSMDWISQ